MWSGRKAWGVLMKISRISLALALVGTALGVAMALPVTSHAQAPATAVPPELPLKDFFRNPERGYFRLSEDGRWLGSMQPAPGKPGATPRRNVFVQRLQDGQPQGTPKQLTFETARDISAYRWKGNGTLLYEKDFGGDENFHVVAVDAATGKVRDLTPWDGVRASVVDELIDDPAHILVSHNRRDRKLFDVVRLNVRTGAQTVLATNPGNITGWLTDHQGRVRIGVASDGVNNTVMHRSAAGGAFKPIIHTDFRTSVTPLFFDRDNKKLYATSNRGRDKAALVLLDPAAPEQETVVFEHPQVDIYSAEWSRTQKRLTQAIYQTDRTQREIFDPATRAMFDKLSKQLPGYELVLQSATRDETRFVVAALSDLTQGTRYFYDSRSDRLVKLGELAPWLPEALMAPMKPVSYTSRDGLAIPGYLTLPVGRGSEEPALHHQPAWWPLGARRLGLQPRSAVWPTAVTACCK
jgi:dipeptidyl aminopeptidase/acylaminoacyl peptidase